MSTFLVSLWTSLYTLGLRCLVYVQLLMLCIIIKLSQWRNIAKQFNASPNIAVKRCFGSRTDHYTLLAYTDSSKQIFGAVLYLLNQTTGELSFVLAKNRIVNKQLENKTIPTLELQAIMLGVKY